MSLDDSTSSDEDETLADEFRRDIEHILQSSYAKASLLPKSVAAVESHAVTEKGGHLCLEHIIEDTWTHFSSKHKISPFNVNNNVQPTGVNKARQRQFKHSQPSQLSKFQGSPLEKNNGQSVFKNQNEILGLKYIYNVTMWLLKLFYNFLKVVGIAILALFVFYCIFILHKPTQRFISRNTQDLIYPLMRTLRLISIPAVEMFPILSDYYEESCLISNPYYEIEELECWPCENVRHVLDLTGLSNFSAEYHHTGIPFVVKDAFSSEINMGKVRKIVQENPDLLGKAFVETSHFGVTTLKSILDSHYSEAFNSEDFHLKWYINRVVIARLWRNYFPKPYFIPKSTEVSVQHFLFVDRPLSKTYRLPLTEFANVFLTQASGSRSIVLIPTKHCQKECKVVSAVLKPKDVLFYNWLFWRPMSVAADSTTFQSTSVTFIGSFY